MQSPGEKALCPHCNAPLRAFRLPDDSGWTSGVQWACFNNDCPYYLEGWKWMWDQYQVKASYRYRVVNLETGGTSPLGVWSETALLDRIVDDD